MKESEAVRKICPFKLGGNSDGYDGFFCEGSGCMGWDAWSPQDPPQGDCGMKPKEVE